MTALNDTVIRSLSTLEDEFRCDELGYLALTTKIEQPIRDRWAFSLHKTLAPQGYSIAREWNAGDRRYIDLAILKNQVPTVLLELKAMYTFDAVSDRCRHMHFISKLSADIERASRMGSGAHVYGVLLATHLDKEIAGEYHGIVKYADEINRAIRRQAGADRVRSRAIDAVDHALTDFGKVSSGELCGGRALDVGVSVLWWLLNKTRAVRSAATRWERECMAQRGTTGTWTRSPSRAICCDCGHPLRRRQRSRHPVAHGSTTMRCSLTFRLGVDGGSGTAPGRESTHLAFLIWNTISLSPRSVFHTRNFAYNG